MAQHNPLNRLIASRKADAGQIQTEIIIACESAARRTRYQRKRPADWNNAAWRRYVSEAAQAQYRFGDSLRQIYHEIDALERLAAVPVAA